MRVSKSGGGRVRIMLRGKEVEQVRNFKYLGSTLSDDGRCDTEIKIIIALAKEAFSKRKELLTKSFTKSEAKVNKDVGVDYVVV